MATSCLLVATKPRSAEIANCRPFLHCEFRELANANVVVALGKLAFDTVIDVVGKELPGLKKNLLSPRPAFGHGATVALPNGMTLIGSYHPSQQNTFTGKLTEEMLDAIFAHAKQILAS